MIVVVATTDPGILVVSTVFFTGIIAVEVNFVDNVSLHKLDQLGA